jgi:hypothetical protein
LGYKLVLKDSAGATVSTYDPLYTPLLAPLSICEGRLTATTAVPVTTANVSGVTSIFYTPYMGNRIALYDGTSSWLVRTFAEITISLVGLTASKPYDIFAYDNAGTVTIETLVWTNTTTRATALTLQNGVYVKSGATTRRYLGTVYINSSGGQTDDTLLKRYIWNYYHRVPRGLAVFETTNSWTYTTNTWRQANGATGNQVEIMVGVAEVPLSLALRVGFSHSAGAIRATVAIGQDSTSATPSATTGAWGSVAPAGITFQSVAAIYETFPVVGYHFYPWMEISEASGTMTWYGDNGSNAEGPNSGMVGSIEG